MRSRKTLIAIALLCIAAAQYGLAAAPKKRSAPARSSSSAVKRPVAKKGAPASRSKRGSSAKQTASKGRTSGPARQNAPAPERYMQIQQALADKGYYNGAVNGVWDASCVDALRRFQQDQNLQADGKLGSLSLIALGLGPKRAPLQSQFLGKPEGAQ